MVAKAKQKSLAVGDHIRLKSRDANQHKSFAVTSAAVPNREAVDGLVLSIRDVKTGRLVKDTTGSADQYVIEMVYDRTFNARFASPKNAPRGSERAITTPGWRRLRDTLHDAAEKGEFYSTAQADLFTDSPITKQLDGWKVIKVWSQEVESLE